MPAQMKIKTRCPVCKAAYHVPGSSVGHRARCPKCDSVFRVLVPGLQSSPQEPRQQPNPAPHPSPEPSLQRPHSPKENNGRHAPTDDDIVAWLMEGENEDDLPPQPRAWHSSSEPPKKASA